MSPHRLWAISPGPFRQLQGSRLCENDATQHGTVYEGFKFMSNLPVRERTCLLFARAALRGGLPILAVSIVEVIAE